MSEPFADGEQTTPVRPVNDPESVVAAKDAAAEAARIAAAEEARAAAEAAKRRPSARATTGKAAAGAASAKVKQAVRELTDTVTDPRPATGTTAGRKVRLSLTRIDPWSVMKIAFVLAVALGIVLIVAVSIVWVVLDSAGVWSSVNESVTNIVGSESGESFDVTNYLGPSRVIGLTIMVALLNVVLLTALATLSAFLYNMAAALVGGVRLTLTDQR